MIYGVIPLLNYVKYLLNSYSNSTQIALKYSNSYLLDKICDRIGSTIAVKSGQLGGNADTFMPIFSADTLDFLVTYIPRRGNNTFFSGNLSTRTDLAVNFDLPKHKHT